jgi:hypothetical protein
VIFQSNASDFVLRVNEGCQCLQKSDGRPGKIGRTAKIGPIFAVRVNEGLVSFSVMLLFLSN